MVTKAVKLLRTIIDLEGFSALPNFHTVSASAIEVTQMIVQAVWERELHDKTELSQLPHMQDGQLLQYCLEKKKEKDRVKTVRRMLEKPEDDRRSMLRQMSDEHYNEMLAAAKRFPILDLVKVKLYGTHGRGQGCSAG